MPCISQTLRNSRIKKDLPVSNLPCFYDEEESFCYRCFLNKKNYFDYVFTHCFVETIIKDYSSDDNDLNTLRNVDERLFDQYRHWKFEENTVYDVYDVVGRYNDFTPLEIAPIAYEQYKGFLCFPLPFLHFLFCDLFCNTYCELYDAIVHFQMFDSLYFPEVTVKPSHELISFVDSIICNISVPNRYTSTATDFICYSCKKPVCDNHCNQMGRSIHDDILTRCNGDGCRSVPSPQENFEYISSEVKTPRFMKFFD